MTIPRLPLIADMHGAELMESGPAGFALKVASGELLAVLPYPRFPELLEFENPSSAPKSTWAAQKSIEVFAEFDAAKIKLDRDDTISATERLRRLHLIRKKTEDAMEHIERDFAAEEAAVEASEAAHYSWPPLQAGDLIAAMQDHEIRTRLLTMPEGELTPLLRRLNAGEDRILLEAILRSPLGMGRLSEFAHNGWRSLRDRENPQKRAGLDLRRSYNDWGRKIVGAIQGRLSAKLRA
jgi:hypothetical protein